MSEQQNILEPLATRLEELNKNIVLIYGFNGTGKTRLSVAYKDITKAKNNGDHAEVYYNAYSENLFVLDNEEIFKEIFNKIQGKYNFGGDHN